MINRRFKRLQSHYELSNKEMAEKLGISAAIVSYILSGRNKVSLDTVEKIAAEFPEVSLDWLILGQEPMLRKEQESSALSKEIITELQILQNMNHRAMQDIINRMKKGS